MVSSLSIYSLLLFLLLLFLLSLPLTTPILPFLRCAMMSIEVRLRPEKHLKDKEHEMVTHVDDRLVNQSVVVERTKAGGGGGGGGCGGGGKK